MVLPQLWNTVGVGFTNQEERWWNMHGWVKYKKWQRNLIHKVWITKAIRQDARFKSLPFEGILFWILKFEKGRSSMKIDIFFNFIMDMSPMKID